MESIDIFVFPFGNDMKFHTSLVLPNEKYKNRILIKLFYIGFLIPIEWIMKSHFLKNVFTNKNFKSTVDKYLDIPFYDCTNDLLQIPNIENINFNIEIFAKFIFLIFENNLNEFQIIKLRYTNCFHILRPFLEFLGWSNKILQELDTIFN